MYYAGHAIAFGHAIPPPPSRKRPLCVRALTCHISVLYVPLLLVVSPSRFPVYPPVPPPPRLSVSPLVPLVCCSPLHFTVLRNHRGGWRGMVDLGTRGHRHNVTWLPLSPTTHLHPADSHVNSLGWGEGGGSRFSQTRPHRGSYTMSVGLWIIVAPAWQTELCSFGDGVWSARTKALTRRPLAPGSRCGSSPSSAPSCAHPGAATSATSWCAFVGPVPCVQFGLPRPFPKTSLDCKIITPPCASTPYAQPRENRGLLTWHIPAFSSIWDFAG